MAQQSNSDEYNMRTIESASSLSDMVRESFFVWLSDGHAKKYPPATYLSCIDKVSVYLIRRKISLLNLWELTNFDLFKSVYDKAINDSLFKATDKKTHTIFVQVGKDFLKFLKSKPAIHKASAVDFRPLSQPGSRLTIKEAIIRVLETELHGMTAEQIYNKIIADKLYNFGAQNPKNVVRAEIDRACVNSNYTVRASKSCFRFERNQKGEKVYFLLSSTLTDDTAQPSINVGGESVNSEQSSDKPNNLGFDRPIKHPKQISSVVSSADTCVVDDGIRAVIRSILEKYFPNGIRPKSVIDINKLKNYCREATGETIITADKDIFPLLKAIGICHGEKVFAVPLNGKKALAELLDRLISENNRLIYYDEFYDTHADFLQTVNIFSSELLKSVLFDIHPSLSYSKKYFGITSGITVETEVLRCYETADCLSYEQLKSKLPYVPLDKIKQVLAQNCEFIWVSKEVYTHVSKVQIDGNEMNAAEKKVMSEIAERGYASLASLDVSASLELNPELSESAVKNGLFQICLADRCEKRGKGNIVTLKGMALNAVAVLKDFCLTHDCLTLDELLKFEEEITGGDHSQSLFVAYNTMVRVDENTFVGDSVISFDVEATDKAIALFVHADVIPLQAVTSFTSFPYVDGYSWNWYLLESYCKRFSKQFNYQCLSVNNRNVGAIFRRSAGFSDYIEVLTAAVVASNIELKEKAVGDYLFESRYVAKRTSAVSKVVANARILREES